MAGQKHSYQWDHTENLLLFLHNLVKTNISENKDRLCKFFLESECFATEKFDGTNIGKDEQGQMYSRRMLLEEGQEEFIKTNLKKVKEANIVEFKKKIVDVAGLNGTDVSKCIVYGEFMCNGFYDYRNRGFIGDWKVFGAILEVKKQLKETLEKLLTSGLAVSKKTNNQIQVFANEKFVEIAQSVNLDTPENKGANESIANVIMKNKMDMKKGLLEGLVITIYTEEFGHSVVKWKGAHESQPAAHDKALLTNDLVQNADVDDCLKSAFGIISEVITDTSENIHLNKKVKKLKEDKTRKEKSNKSQKDKCKQPPKGKYLSSQDKTIIEEGIVHSQKKFDCIEEYIKADNLEEYKENLAVEVRNHLAEEKEEFEEIDVNDNIMAFIRHKVNGVIKSQIAHTNTLEEQSKQEITFDETNEETQQPPSFDASSSIYILAFVEIATTVAFPFIVEFVLNVTNKKKVVPERN